jgi:hypothetical protein
MTTNARQFLDEIAELLRAKGREVTVEEQQTDYGTFVWLSALAPHWYDHSLSLSAAYITRTKRWRLGELTVDHKDARKTRSHIRIAAEVYA